MSQPMNPYDSPEAPRPGMSGTAKLFLGLGIGCGVLVLLCCGGFVATFYYFGRSAANSVTKDPAKIREITDKIVAITVPDSLPPATAMEWNLPLFNFTVMTFAQYGDEHGPNLLGLAQFNENFDEKQMRTQWRDSMSQNGRQGFEEIEIEKSETRGAGRQRRAGRVHLGRRAGGNSDDKVWQVTGIVPRQRRARLPAHEGQGRRLHQGAGARDHPLDEVTRAPSPGRAVVALAAQDLAEPLGQPAAFQRGAQLVDVGV